MKHKLTHPVWTWTLAGLLTAGTCGCASHTKTARLATAPPVDEERLYEDCPAWARVTVPEWVTSYLGRHGLPAPYRDQKRAKSLRSGLRRRRCCAMPGCPAKNCN